MSGNSAAGNQRADGPVEFDKARRDPAGVFKDPAAIADHPGLSRAQKVELLRRWEADARELAVADDENMAGGEAQRLDAVLKALDRLGGGHDPHAPTKHG
ncbi:MAG: hypothetical protein CMM50_09485 [Rhodospirillaceae bacterium]|nr:hypothetical protein [Rhodospirillaceae bacterium]